MKNQTEDLEKEAPIVGFRRRMLSWAFWALAILGSAFVVTLINREQVRVNNSRLQETILLTTLAKADAAVVALDREGRVAYASAGLSELTGYTNEELMRMTPEDLMPAAYRQAHREGFARASAGGQGPRQHQVYCQIRTKQGGNISVLNHVFGYPGGGMAIISPTDPSAVQARLYQMALDASGVGVWWWDVSKDRLVWDTTMFRIFGRDEDSWTPNYSGFLEAIHPEDRAWVEEAVADSLGARAPYKVVFRVIRDDGEIVYVRAYGQIFEQVGGVVFAGVNILVAASEYTGEREE
jgi:PAS domain S-box-containing protein